MEREKISMISYTRLLTSALLVMTALLATTTSAAEKQCGERVHVDDVLIADMEDYVEEEELFFEKLHELAGGSVMMTQSPIRVIWAGNPAATINSAKKSAAHEGCDLLVLLGYHVKETRWEGSVTTSRYLMVHLGKRKDP